MASRNMLCDIRCIYRRSVVGEGICCTIWAAFMEEERSIIREIFRGEQNIMYEIFCPNLYHTLN